MPEEYDYRFISDKRDTIIQILQQRYKEIAQKNLKIFAIPENNLKGFTTTEKDLKKGQDKFPPDQFRDTSTDLMEEKKSEAQPQDTGIMDFEQGKKLRDKQFVETQDYNYHNAEEEEADEEENEVKKSVAGHHEYAATTVFKRKEKQDAKLEDFELIKIVGKGTFGKVF